MNGTIRTAIILAAGEGSRLRSIEPSKPLCRVGGKPLIDHALEGLHRAGVTRALVVTGFAAELVERHMAGRRWPLDVETVHNPDWHLPNGVSALAVAMLLADQPALLTMCDHLVDPGLYRRLCEAGAGPGLRLGIDRRLGHELVDPDDVTCVRTEGSLIVAIGKGLEPHDAYDTGVFAVSSPFFEALARLPAPSITEAVRALAAARKAEVVDCSDLDWVDVDDPAALAKADQMSGSGWASGAPVEAVRN